MNKARNLLIFFTLYSLTSSAQDISKHISQSGLYQSYVTARSIENPDELLKAAQSLLDRDSQFGPAWVLIGNAYNSKSQMPHPKKRGFCRFGKNSRSKGTGTGFGIGRSFVICSFAGFSQWQHLFKPQSSIFSKYSA